MNTSMEIVLGIAAGFVGVTEQPRGSNSVVFNTHYYGREVSGDAYPWCAAFVWDVFRLAGQSAAYCGGGKTASCEYVLDYALKNGAFVAKTQLRRGDVVLYKFSGNARAANHIGLVAAASASRVTAIEGNTSVTSDDNGGAVMVRERDLASVVGGYRPQYEEDETMDDAEFARLYERYASATGTGAAHSVWATAATEKMRELGIVSGDGAGSYGWKKPLTKEVAAQMLYNFMRSQDRERTD